MEPHRVTSTLVVYENRWMRLHEDRLERAGGEPGLYAWIETPPAALIVPLDDGDVWLATGLEPGPQEPRGHRARAARGPRAGGRARGDDRAR